MRETSVKCDFCGKQKGATNHWWIVQILDVGFSHQSGGVFQLTSEKNRTSLADSDWKDACGEKCVSTAVSRYLATGTLDEK